MGGGIFLGVRHGLYETVMIDSGDKAQFVTVRLTNEDFNVQIVLVYGPKKMTLKISGSPFITMFLYKFRKLI